MKTLILVSHPNIERSIANKTIIKQAEERIETFEIRYLEKLYPDFKIDVEAEQKALAAADIIILQHPFYWYSVPAMLKQWFDTVWTWGFAYGQGGDKLKDKHLIQSITVGGPKEAYTPLGYNHFEIEEFLRPVQQSVYLAQLKYHKPIYSFRNFYAENIWNSVTEVQNNAKKHATRLISVIENISKSNTEKVEKFIYEWFKHFDILDENGYFTQYLDTNVLMKFPEKGEFNGHDGFHKWYNETKADFIGNTTHDINGLNIKEVEKDTFQITMNIQLGATTIAEEKLKLDARESWMLVWDTTSDRPIIKEYFVEI